jgi:hypothetical protein
MRGGRLVVRTPLSTHSADEAERLFHGIVAKMCGVNSDKRLLDFEHLDRDSSHHRVFTRIVVTV